MVLSLPDNLENGSPPFSPDVAACRRKCWLVRRQQGLGGANPSFYLILTRDVGRHGHGTTATWHSLLIWKHMGGRWERCNLIPTGGRQRCGDTPSGMETTTGDDRRVYGAVVLRGATSADRRIAQASHAAQTGLCGVLRLRARTAGAEGCLVTGRWTRVQDMTRVGKPGFRNIYPAKGFTKADCTARCGSCSAGHRTWQQGRRVGERGKVCRTSHLLHFGRGGQTGSGDE